MKKKLIYLSLILTAFIFSCKKDTNTCDDIICEGNSTCVNGTCACEEGYEGDDCETYSRDKFIANWSGSDTCQIVLAGMNDSGQTEIITYDIIARDSSGNHNYVVFEYINEEGGYQIFGTTHQQRLTIPLQTQFIQLSDLPYPIDGTLSGNGRLFNNNASMTIKTSISGNVFIQGVGMIPATCECSGVMHKEGN